MNETSSSATCYQYQTFLTNSPLQRRNAKNTQVIRLLECCSMFVVATFRSERIILLGSTALMMFIHPLSPLNTARALYEQSIVYFTNSCVVCALCGCGDCCLSMFFLVFDSESVFSSSVFGFLLLFVSLGSWFCAIQGTFRPLYANLC